MKRVRGHGAVRHVAGSLPARGAWVETLRRARHRPLPYRRSPQGERGLKRSCRWFDLCIRQSLPARGAWVETQSASTTASRSRSLPARGAWVETSASTRPSRWTTSLPARGAWVETCSPPTSFCPTPSLPARGAWVETVWSAICQNHRFGRSPQGERGLKLVGRCEQLAAEQSLPARGAWVETRFRRAAPSTTCTSLPARGAWVETSGTCKATRAGSGRSPQGERGLKLLLRRVQRVRA